MAVYLGSEIVSSGGGIGGGSTGGGTQEFFEIKFTRNSNGKFIPNKTSDEVKAAHERGCKILGWIGDTIFFNFDNPNEDLFESTALMVTDSNVVVYRLFSFYDNPSNPISGGMGWYCDCYFHMLQTVEISS